MPSKTPLLTLSAASISYAHTVLGFAAFFGALVIALSLHYRNVVKNGVAGYPDEWWPSVSATIGDWPHERSVLQIFIALMSGPRLALVLLSALLVSLSNPEALHARLLAFTGILRTLSCGGWVFCTSTDFPMVHDIAMITYLVLTPAWMYISWGSLAPQPNKSGATTRDKVDTTTEKARKSRGNTACAFFASIPFMIIFYYRHKVLKIPGAYTIYSFFEWNLIIQDLLFDFWSLYDLSRLEIHIVEATFPDSSPLLGGSWWEGGAWKAVKDGAWSTLPTTEASRKSVPNTSSATNEVQEVDALLSKRDGHKTLPIQTTSATREALALASDTYLSFLWWTTVTALHPSIFFFSVYNLSMGGHEILLVSQVFALALALIPTIQDRLLSPLRQVYSLPIHWTLTLWLVTLASIWSWWIPEPLVRLSLTGVANFAASVLHALEWGRAWQQGEDKLQRQVVVWLTGLILSSLSKYANHSNNPLWPFMNSTNGGHHAVGLAIAAVCIYESILRPVHAPVTRLRANQSKSSEAAAALGLGALLFGLHSFLSDSGTMISWGWTGYPIKGPMAVPHGWIILTVALASTALSFFRPTIDRSPIMVLGLAASNFVLLLFDDWTSFAGAIGTAAFLPLLVSPLAELALKHHPLRVMLWSWLVADLLTFFQVLTVAYAFVPGGMPFRERTWMVLIVYSAFLLAGLAKALPDTKLPSPIKPSFYSVSSRTLRRFILGLLTALGAVSFAVARLRTIDTSKIVPHHQHDGSRGFTAGIQTVHFGLDQLFYDSSRRMSDLYADMQLDVFGLLETDLQRSVFGNRDLTQWLAQELGMYADIGPGPDKHTWGAALFSKFPILRSTHHLMPSPDGELAPAIHAVLDVFGVEVNVLVSHNGQEETPLDRQLQTEYIANISTSVYPDPFLFLGYVVTKPGAPRPAPYYILFEDGKLLDVDPLDRYRWCQYIGFRSLSRVGYVRVSRYTISDTELQTAKFRVPDLPNGEAPIPPDVDDRPRLANHDMVPSEFWYPTHYVNTNLSAKPYEAFIYRPWVYARYYRPAKEERKEVQ